MQILSVPYKYNHMYSIYICNYDFQSFSSVDFNRLYLRHQTIHDETLLLVHLRLNVLCLLFVSYSTQYCSRSASLSKDFTSRILRKSIRRETRYFMQTDGRIKADSRLAQIVCDHAYLLIGYNVEVIGERAG